MELAGRPQKARSMAKPNPVAPKTTTAAKFGPGILRGEKCGLETVTVIPHSALSEMFDRAAPVRKRLRAIETHRNVKHVVGLDDSTTPYV